MPEMLFDIAWPDGTTERCDSPSLVIRDHFTPGASYALDDFLARSRAALTEASERVRARHGFPCARALGQLAAIEARARRHAADASVRVVGFIE